MSTVRLAGRPVGPEAGHTYQLSSLNPVLVLEWDEPNRKGTPTRRQDVFLAAQKVSEASTPKVTLRLRGMDWDRINKSLSYGRSYGHEPDDTGTWVVEFDDQREPYVCWK